MCADAPEEESQLAKWREEITNLEAAESALTALLAEGQCAPLVEAVITKYLALTMDELQEWQVSGGSALHHPPVGSRLISACLIDDTGKASPRCMQCGRS